MTLIPLYNRERFRESWSGLVSGKAEILHNPDFEPTMNLLGEWVISESEDVCHYLHESNNRTYDDQVYLTLDILDEVYNSESIGLYGSFYPLAIGIKENGSPIFGWLRSQKPSPVSDKSKMYIQQGEAGAITMVSEFDHVIRDATPSMLANVWRRSLNHIPLPMALTELCFDFCSETIAI